MGRKLNIYTVLVGLMIYIFTWQKILKIIKLIALTEKYQEKNRKLCIKHTRSIQITKALKKKRVLSLNSVISALRFYRRQLITWINIRLRRFIKKSQKIYFKNIKICGKKNRNKQKELQPDKVSLYILQQMYQQTDDRDKNLFQFENGQQRVEASLISQDIQIKQQEQPAGVPPQTMIARNRRYCKLKYLWKEGFFQEESIMLNFPLLYYDYVGKYKKIGSISNNFKSMSDFLQQQLLHSEYRQILGSELKNIKEQDNQKNKSKTQQSSSSPFQMDAQSQQQGNQKQSQYEQKLEEISQANLQLQEQALIQEIELRFIEGRIKNFNYAEIDLDENLDDWKTKQMDEQQRYFNQMDEQEQRDPSSNTGIQDF